MECCSGCEQFLITRWNHPFIGMNLNESLVRRGVDNTDANSSMVEFTVCNDTLDLTLKVAKSTLGQSQSEYEGKSKQIHSCNYRHSALKGIILYTNERHRTYSRITFASTVDIVATSALGKNTVVDADGDGIPITVVLAGATGSGTIELTMYWVLD